MKKPSSYLHSFHPIFPEHCFKQSQLVDWVTAAHMRSQEMSNQKIDQRLKRFAVNDAYIKQRYTEYGDASQNWKDHAIFKITQESPGGVDIKVRNEFYARTTLKKFESIYANKPTPKHLIHVTCTGYIAPSAPQVYFANKTQTPSITHAYHMGCYASLPALRIANSFSQQGLQVDIVHNEICSIHFNPTEHSPEQIVVQTLFADGHIYYQVSLEEKGFRILGIKEKILPDSTDDMGWIPSPLGMNMSLSRKVPNKIEGHIINFMMEMIKEFNLELPSIMKHAIFAIHPGGPRIIEVIKNKLELRDDQIRESKNVLLTRGNMSSATLPHIWNEIYLNQYPSGTPIVSLAFGPGLTVFGSIFEVA